MEKGAIFRNFFYMCETSEMVRVKVVPIDVSDHLPKYLTVMVYLYGATCDCRIDSSINTDWYFARGRT